MNWDVSKNFLAQANHFLAAALVVALTALAGYDGWWGVGAITLFAVGKEFWADAKTFLPGSGWLENDSLQGSAVDCFFYEAGAFVCQLAIAHLVAGLLVGFLWLAGMALYDWAAQQSLGLD